MCVSRLGGGHPGGRCIHIICAIKLNERARFSPRPGNGVDTNVSFSVYNNHPVVRAVCIGLLCVSRMFNVYIYIQGADRCSRPSVRGPPGECDRIGSEGILLFRFLTKRAMTLYLIRVNIIISHLCRRPYHYIYMYVFIIRLTRVRGGAVVWNLLSFDGFLISRTGFI